MEVDGMGEGPVSDRGRPLHDLTGQRFGRLVAVRYAGTRSKKTYWECVCDCGGTKITQASDLLNGTTRSCNCLRNRKPGEAARHNRYLNYRQAAVKRGLAFELSPEDFAAITQELCHYCGAPPSNIHASVGNYNGAFVYNGIDRKDNTLGYTGDNCVPCCAECNYAKRQVAYASFVAWLDRVAAFRNPSFR